MTNGNQSVNLAMPVGLPAPGIDPVAHYRDLTANISVEATNVNMVSVWTVNQDRYSGLYAMTKGFLRYIPAGGSAPDDTITTSPMLVLKSWLWDYLELRKNAVPGLPLPKLIAYGHADHDAISDAVRTELSTNPRYRSLSDSERAQAESDFLAGRLTLLTSSATFIG